MWQQQSESVLTREISFKTYIAAYRIPKDGRFIRGLRRSRNVSLNVIWYQSRNGRISGILPTFSPYKEKWECINIQWD